MAKTGVQKGNASAQSAGDSVSDLKLPKGTDRRIVSFIRALESDDLSTQRAVAEHFVNTAHYEDAPLAIPSLLKAMRSPDNQLKAHAAWSLATVRSMHPGKLTIPDDIRASLVKDIASEDVQLASASLKLYSTAKFRKRGAEVVELTPTLTEIIDNERHHVMDALGAVELLLRWGELTPVMEFYSKIGVNDPFNHNLAEQRGQDGSSSRDRNEFLCDQITLLLRESKSSRIESQLVELSKKGSGNAKSVASTILKRRERDKEPLKELKPEAVATIRALWKSKFD